jgi:UPF0755 protein
MFVSRLMRRILLGMGGGFLLFLCVVAYGFQYYNSAGPLTEETTLLFKKGTGFEEIVDQMAEAGVIRHKLTFKVIAVLNGQARKFKAGEYRFTAFTTPRLIMDMIGEGKVVIHRLTVAEGLTVQQIKDLLAKELLLEGEISGTIPEGSLLPETYHYTYGDLRQGIIDRMQSGMKDTIAELWEKRKKDLPITTPEQAVVLASIVEKETGVASERGLVASVFINRLRKGMKLQSDPTAIYAVEKDKGPLNRLPLLSDLKYDSPYNTYMYPGLPPAPISNPGRAALEAVLNPPETAYLFFVATGNGGHNFSSTLAGHNDNVKNYRRTLDEKRQEKAADKKPAEDKAPAAVKTEEKK